MQPLCIVDGTRSLDPNECANMHERRTTLAADVTLYWPSKGLLVEPQGRVTTDLKASTEQGEHEWLKF